MVTVAHTMESTPRSPRWSPAIDFELDRVAASLEVRVATDSERLDAEDLDFQQKRQAASRERRGQGRFRRFRDEETPAPSYPMMEPAEHERDTAPYNVLLSELAEVGRSIAELDTQAGTPPHQELLVALRHQVYDAKGRFDARLKRWQRTVRQPVVDEIDGVIARADRAIVRASEATANLAGFYKLLDAGLSRSVTNWLPRLAKQLGYKSADATEDLAGAILDRLRTVEHDTATLVSGVERTIERAEATVHEEIEKGDASVLTLSERSLNPKHRGRLVGYPKRLADLRSSYDAALPRSGDAEAAGATLIPGGVTLETTDHQRGLRVLETLSELHGSLDSVRQYTSRMEQRANQIRRREFRSLASAGRETGHVIEDATAIIETRLSGYEHLAQQFRSVTAAARRAEEDIPVAYRDAGVTLIADAESAIRGIASKQYRSPNQLLPVQDRLRELDEQIADYRTARIPGVTANPSFGGEASRRLSSQMGTITRVLSLHERIGSSVSRLVSSAKDQVASAEREMTHYHEPITSHYVRPNIQRARELLSSFSGELDRSLSRFSHEIQELSDTPFSGMFTRDALAQAFGPNGSFVSKLAGYEAQLRQHDDSVRHTLGGRLSSTYRSW